MNKELERQAAHLPVSPELYDILIESEYLGLPLSDAEQTRLQGYRLFASYNHGEVAEQYMEAAKHRQG